MYQQFNYPQYQNWNQYQQRQTPGIQYVNGIDSAKAYQLGPSQSVLLMDSELSRFYVKSTDASGFASIKAYDFSEVQERPAEQADFVKRAEFNDLITRLNNLSEEINKFATGSNLNAQGE